jgi:hypothetical protein
VAAPELPSLLLVRPLRGSAALRPAGDQVDRSDAL